MKSLANLFKLTLILMSGLIQKVTSFNRKKTMISFIRFGIYKILMMKNLYYN